MWRTVYYWTCVAGLYLGKHIALFDTLVLSKELFGRLHFWVIILLRMRNCFSGPSMKLSPWHVSWTSFLQVAVTFEDEPPQFVPFTMKASEGAQSIIVSIKIRLRVRNVKHIIFTYYLMYGRCHTVVTENINSRYACLFLSVLINSTWALKTSRVTLITRGSQFCIELLGNDHTHMLFAVNWLLPRHS